MLQLPPDSHWATPVQSWSAADAGVASTPMPMAAAPRTTAPLRRERLRARVIEVCMDMGDPPITACEVSCRVRANRCPAVGAVDDVVRLHPETRMRVGKWVLRPRPGWVGVRHPADGVGRSGASRSGREGPDARTTLGAAPPPGPPNGTAPGDSPRRGVATPGRDFS